MPDSVVDQWRDQAAAKGIYQCPVCHEAHDTQTCEYDAYDLPCPCCSVIRLEALGCL